MKHVEHVKNMQDVKHIRKRSQEIAELLCKGKPYEADQKLVNLLDDTKQTFKEETAQLKLLILYFSFLHEELLKQERTVKPVNLNLLWSISKETWLYSRIPDIIIFPEATAETIRKQKKTGEMLAYMESMTVFEEIEILLQNKCLHMPKTGETLLTHYRHLKYNYNIQDYWETLCQEQKSKGTCETELKPVLVAYRRDKHMRNKLIDITEIPLEKGKTLTQFAIVPQISIKDIPGLEPLNWQTLLVEKETLQTANKLYEKSTLNFQTCIEIAETI